MNIRFDGRVAIITGAGNGLGRAYALELARRGARVVVNDIAKEPVDGGTTRPADLVVQTIRAAGGQAVATYESVGSRAGADANVAAAMDSFGRVDIVINNAGNQANNRFELMSDAQFQSVLDVHLTGAFYLTQTAYRHMLKQGYGRVLFTSSASGLFGHYIRANYGAAKSGLIGLMNVVSLEGARSGITANALLPMAASATLGKVPENLLHPEWEARMPEKQPDMRHFNGVMTPDHVAPLAVYLVSETCQSTHAIYSAVGGRYSRIVIGSTPGWLADPERPATVEELAEHFGQVCDASSIEEYPQLTDEALSVAKRLAAARAAK